MIFYIIIKLDSERRVKCNIFTMIYYFFMYKIRHFLGRNNVPITYLIIEGFMNKFVILYSHFSNITLENYTLKRVKIPKKKSSLYYLYST